MKKLIALLLVFTALFLCACGQTENNKKLESGDSDESTQTTGGSENDNEAEVINAQVSFAVENKNVKITLTDGTVARVQVAEVEDIAALIGSEDPAKLTWKYQYEGIFLQEDNTYTLLLTKCRASADLECADKNAAVTALLLALEAAEVEDTVYASYQKVLAGETCDAASLGDFESENWALTLKNGKLADVQMFDAKLALTSSIEFYGDNNVKSYIEYNTTAATYVVREYNENGDPTLCASYGIGGVLAEKAEYTYFESGELQSMKRYIGVALDYECEYDVEGNILFERDYRAENESNSDTFDEGDELPEQGNELPGQDETDNEEDGGEE